MGGHSDGGENGEGGGLNEAFHGVLLELGVSIVLRIVRNRKRKKRRW
jgi:hypothetical protein